MTIYTANDEKAKVQRALKRVPEANPPEHIEIGDFVVGEYIIERKEVNDLITSAVGGRLFRQLENIKNFCRNHGFKGILLIEGWKINKHVQKLLKITSVIELQVNAMEHFGVQVISTQDLNGTVRFLQMLDASQKGAPSAIKSVRGFKRKLTLHERKIFFLEGIPAIGEARSKKILRDYSSIMEYFKETIENKPNSVLYNILM
jgi:ERCC4-type nuclease